MHVGVGISIVVGNGIDYGVGLLGGRGVVEVGKRFASKAFFEDGEVSADRLKIESSSHDFDTASSKETATPKMASKLKCSLISDIGIT
tara:strand:+ start:475 stop:738 length:264 start_codon:yes stop_codon:yes gene_type:complete